MTIGEFLLRRLKEAASVTCSAFPATTTSSDAFDAVVIPCNIGKDILRADITAWIGARLPGSAKSGSDD
jgi:hypothetical protein